MRIITLFIALLMAPLLWATHLIGGNLGYTYLGETAPGSQVYRYRVTLEFYMNCGTTSNFQTIHQLLVSSGSVPLAVGVYTEDPTAPNADKDIFTTVPMTLTDSAEIIPDLPNGCAFGQGLCMVKGIFTGTVDLPLTLSGYHLYYQMCCRNNGILNLANPSGVGIGYYAFIPPSLVNNSSPTFLGVPTPFLCVGDTSTFLNTTSDNDGDQLIFSFEKPYNSVTPGGGIGPPPVQLPWPVPEVLYGPTFSVAQPLGPTGYAFMNDATGLTSYMPPQIGNSVVATEVKEYRNGQLIGRTRRDLQLQAITCSANNAPVVTGALPIMYEVDAGAPLCFNMAFSDPNNDTLSLTASGTIFDPSVFSPAATITAPATGNASVGAQFCWNTTCDQAQDQPYLFSVTTTDNGCPPKSLDVVFQVHVAPFAGPQAISGPAHVCAAQTGVAYSTADSTGATFSWTATGGTIASGQGTHAIAVDWGAAGTGDLSVSATNALGCSSVPTGISVTIAAAPSIEAGRDTTVCSGEPVVLGGSPTGPIGSSFTWTPITGLDDPSAEAPTASALSTTTYVVAVSNAGCVARDSIRVTISSPNPDAGSDVAICTGDTTQLNGIGPAPYSWSPATGLSSTTSATPLAFPTIETDYVLTLQDTLGCVASDTVHVAVNPIPFADAGDDVQICPGSATTIGGTPTGPSGAQFLWSPITALTEADVANPEASPTANTTYVVSVTAQQCTATDTVVVNVSFAVPVDAGENVNLCHGDSVQLHATGNGNFQWSPSNGLSNPNIADPMAAPQTTTWYVVQLNDTNTCNSMDSVLVTVVGTPSANAGPDRWVCAGFAVQLQGSGSGTPHWQPSSGLNDAGIATPQASPALSTTYTLTVTDGNGCTANDDVLVSVGVDPPLDAGPDQSLCSGMSAVLGGTPTSIPGASYVWSPATGLDNSSAANPTTTPDALTLYTLTVTSDTCTSQDQVLVTMQGAEAAAFTVRLEPGCTDIRAFFTSVSAGATQYLWDFGDGTTATGSSPLHTFPYDAPIVVTLTAADGNGCSGSITDTIPASQFTALTDYELPNIFTPNGDDRNDTFGPMGESAMGDCGSLLIFNRWGQKQFESFGRNMRWDGRDFAGQPCVSGTYFYTITLNDITSNGTIQLQR